MLENDVRNLLQHEDLEGELAARFIGFMEQNSIPTNVIDQLAGSCVVAGDEKDGKSSLVGNILQQPVVFSARDTATRAVVTYLLRYDPNAVEPDVTVLDRTEHHHETNPSRLRFQELPELLKAIMDCIRDGPGVELNGMVTVAVMSNDSNRQALRVVHLPGLVARTPPRHTETPHFASRSGFFLDSSELPQTSHSHVPLVAKASANLRNSS